MFLFPFPGERAKLVANTGIGLVDTANTNLDGTGTLATVLTAANPKGTFIKTVTIKAFSTSINQGMIRLFIYDGTNTRLLLEIPTPIAGSSGTFASFSRTIHLNYFLKATYVLKASTQETKNFSVIAEGFDVSYF